MFLADAHSKRIQSAHLNYDGFGVCAVNINRIIDYGDDWDSVISLCVSNNKLFVSHNEGVTVLGGGHGDLRCCGVDVFFNVVMR